MSYAGHPYYKRIDSFNVEGSQITLHKKEKRLYWGRDWVKYVFILMIIQY